MFGIGYQEMFIILVVALVIFGPARLPEMAGQVGRWVRDFRRMSGELTGEFEKTFAEVEEVKRSIKREMQSIQDEVEGVSKSTRGDLKKSPARSSTGAKKATGGALKSGSTTGTAAKTAGAKTEPAANGARTKMPALEGRKRDGKGKLAVELDLSALPVATKADPLVDVSPSPWSTVPRMAPPATATRRSNGCAGGVPPRGMVAGQRSRSRCSHSRGP
jgi:sec-independent protein translocase protein TatB